jgi:hypothetical protein
MSFVLDAFQDALYAWIKDAMKGAVPDEQIIWRDQSQPLPPRPCVTMRITDGPKAVGNQDNVSDAGGGKFNVGGQRTLTVAFEVLGNSQVQKPMAFQSVINLHRSLGLMTVRERLRSAGISVQERGDPLNLTQLEESEFEERAHFDVVFGVADNITDDPGTIESVNGTGIVGETTVPIRVRSN